MKFSIIIPSYLGAYQHAASNREAKLIRAIDSCTNQNFRDYEIMVVADGCEKTFDIVSEKYEHIESVDCLLIRKQPLWSGSPRNYGINKSKGDYIIYLDADDYLGENHLQIVSDHLGDLDWCWWNDLLKKRDGTHYERNILITDRFQNGTSNICHKRSLDVKWSGSGYGLDDWSLVQQLHRFTNNVKIKTPEYFVCHTQQGLDI